MRMLCTGVLGGGGGGGGWCNHDSGYSTITDSRGYPRGVYVSARRDGSVWLRFGRDHASLEWTFVDERRARLQTVILHDDDLALLRVCSFLRTIIPSRFCTLRIFISAKISLVPVCLCLMLKIRQNTTNYSYTVDVSVSTFIRGSFL